MEIKDDNKLHTNVSTSSSVLVLDIKSIIEQGRRQAYSSINMSMMTTYWNIGKRIIEEEQHGGKRAEYGMELLKRLSDELVPEFGVNFKERRLRDYRQFYLCFKDLEIWHSRMPNLTWTHIRHLLRVSDDKARLWYMNEANLLIMPPRLPALPMCR